MPLGILVEATERYQEESRVALMRHDGPFESIRQKWKNDLLILPLYDSGESLQYEHSNKTAKITLAPTTQNC